ncbi:acyltransferase [Bradyrhizobium sp. CCBAU 53351]|uniref:acyltransferase family protein n=1 Tax=Bradyrhizobium sp. CCBAU 53351 TaxID=1325114 RepID=UPI0018879A4B|nr:acyltransferase [Bradyrhizobium sp. CCBAU 53351]
MVFHFFGATLPGGFLGVDVFFVVSGFLIVGLILDEISAASFSFLRFYERRIRRLVPVAAIVTLTTCLAAWLLSLPPELIDFSKSLAASATFLSNWYFLATVGYLDGPATLKPLLHTWSLSIEEQFYLVVPAVMVACARLHRVRHFSTFVRSIARLCNLA